jgi:hypothetical protein
MSNGMTSAVEWSDGVEKDGKGWPILHASDDCDGCNPMTGRRCTLGRHQGYHRDATGAEWLDDGDMANPDWLDE